MLKATNQMEHFQKMEAKLEMWPRQTFSQTLLYL